AIGDVLPGGAAARAGLQSGDRVVAIDGRAIETWDELVAAVVASAGRPLELQVDRGGSRQAIAVTPDDAGGRGRLGIGPSMKLV
ncbi:PDZ domain-containing protein, partial [Salmonella enterica]|uniref:PDZ domain-containing protein n=1 Tax=Salmonella enterica TaxID=28901 RepID=UPI0032972B9E